MSLGVAQFSPEVFSLFFLSVLSVYFLAVGKTLDSSLHPFQELRHRRKGLQTLLLLTK